MISSRRRRVWLGAVAAVPLAVAVAGEARQAPTAAATPDFFETKVRPVLATSCYDCHTDERFGGLRVDSREALLKGGRSGPALVPGDPDASLIVQAVRQTSDKLKMPKGGRLKQEEIDALVEWVRAGAPWFTIAPGDAEPSSTPTARAGKPYVITPEQR